MKYKGKTVQFQRVRAKKGPKIQEMNDVENNEEERQRLETKSFEHQKRKMVEEVVEATPDWQLYCILTHDSNVLG